ncbi:MAG: type 4a pilus biogenesis protein PilO [Candidatus Paceibacterota bacterium]|jgi:Tfp pilus assembly protein PilO
MRASSKRALSIGIAALFLIGALVVYGTLIQPTFVDIEKMRAELNVTQTLFNNQKTATEQVSKAFSDMKNAAKTREVISQALPVGPNITLALHQIESTIRANKVTIDALTIRAVSPEPNKKILAKRLGKLELNFSASGGYGPIRDFIKNLETNIRVINITNFEFTPVSNRDRATSEELYAIQIVAEMYYQED